MKNNYRGINALMLAAVICGKAHTVKINARAIRVRANSRKATRKV